MKYYCQGKHACLNEKCHIVFVLVFQSVPKEQRFLPKQTEEIKEGTNEGIIPAIVVV